jgi:methylase of polypeptide subunit release factors
VRNNNKKNQYRQAAVEYRVVRDPAGTVHDLGTGSGAARITTKRNNNKNK